MFCTNRAQSLYMLTVFPSLVQELFFSHFTSILQMFSRLSYNSYLHLSLFCRGSRISVFLLLVSSVIRLEYQTTQASCVKG